MTIWTKRSPPTKRDDGLATAIPGALHDAAWSGPVTPPRRGGRLARLRQRLARHPFKLLVLLPTALAAFYFFGIATPQYESEARFLIRGRQASSASSSLGEAMQSAGFRPASCRTPTTSTPPIVATSTFAQPGCRISAMPAEIATYPRLAIHPG